MVLGSKLKNEIFKEINGHVDARFPLDQKHPMHSSLTQPPDDAQTLSSRVKDSVEKILATKTLNTKPQSGRLDSTVDKKPVTCQTRSLRSPEPRVSEVIGPNYQVGG